MAIKFKAGGSAKKPRAKSSGKSKRKPATKPRAKVAPAQTEPKPAAKPRGKTGPKPGNQKGGTTPKLELVGVEKVIEVLRASGGIKAVAAERLSVSRTTLYAFIDQHPEVGEALFEIDGEIGDIAEAKVVTAIQSGDMQTVRWYLETKGKDRGYTRRVENTGANGGPVEVRQQQDLSQLSEKELEILAKAAAQRESKAGAR